VLRGTPSTTAPGIDTLAPGTVVDVLPESAEANGFSWVKVRTPAGLEGWVVSPVVQ
jgi:hypothetical protein